MFMQEDTIVAIATAPGNGAVGIVRLSGPKALSSLATIWNGRTKYENFEPRHLYHGAIIETDSGEPLDEVLVVWMPGPHSYTGEDLVEIQAHGGYRLLEAIVESLVKAGARLALPGEFTQRAFMNGKMDLAQAEAVADLINASSLEAARIAQRNLSGQLSDRVQGLKNNLLVLRAQMEAMIDFPEDEDVQGLNHAEIGERVRKIQDEIKGILETYREGRAFREGIRVAIVGKPNVGKSSLLNALLKEDRAIVHPTPGTTRDAIEETLIIDGLPIRFIDTAGLRKGEEAIEVAGIQKTREKISKADLVLAVFDSSREWDKEDDQVLEAIGSREALHLYNKVDLTPLLNRESGGLKISAKTGEGIEDLKKKIFFHFIRKDVGGGVVLTNTRHKTALEGGLEALSRVTEGAKEKISLEFLAADLLIATNHLAEITGEITNDQVLGEIFSKFCIGK